MPWEVFQKVADECAQHAHNLVRLSSAGEILMHPKAVQMIEYLLEKKQDKNVALTTNGSLLDPEKSLRLLKAGIRSIEISMDASDKQTYEAIRVGLSFEETLCNVRELVRLRNEGGYDTRLMVSIIEQDANKERLDEITAFWENIVDVVLVRKLLAFGGLVERRTTAAAYLPKETPCPFLWERMLIDPAGNARGCVNDIMGRGIVGNVLEKSIAEIWRGEPLATWRQMHLEGKKQNVPVCEGCQDSEYRSWEYNYFHALSKDIHSEDQK